MKSWRTALLGTVVTLQRGFDLPTRTRRNGPIPIVSSAGITGFHETSMVRPPGVVTGRYGTIGEVFLLTEPFWPLNTTLYVRDFHGNDPQFIYYLLQRFDFRAFSGKSGVPGVNRNDLHAEQISLPCDVDEQRAIAQALSDVDALLAGLDRLIAKKRDLKQATLQQLLSGLTRLPGFKGKWQVMRLGDHLEFLRNGVNARGELTSDGRIKYLHYGDIHAAKGVYLDVTGLPSLPTSKAKSLDRLRDGDLILADASEDLAGVGKSVEVRILNDQEVVSGLHTIAVRFDKSVLVDGFKGLLQFCPAFREQLRRLAAGTKVFATNRKHLASVELPLPSTDEQRAISGILSDVDAELMALEARRDKTRLLKQGMMQELLTGRTRLVPAGAADD